MSTVCLVVRPGETGVRWQSRIQGSLDLPLTEVGQQQVQNIIDELRKRRSMSSTPLPEPAATTAEMIGDALGAPAKVVEGLANSVSGAVAGDVSVRHPPQASACLQTVGRQSRISLCP